MNLKVKIEHADEMMRAGKPHETVNILESVIAQSPQPNQMAELYSKLGVAYIQTGKLKDAIASFSKAIEHDEYFARAYQNLTLAYMQSGDIAKAVEIGEQGVSSNPDSPELLKALARAKRADDDVQGALEHTERAQELEPENPVLLMYLGSLLYELGRKEEATECLKKSLNLRPDYVSAQRMLSLVHKYKEDDPYFQQL
ncbi:MAG: tetratricopeptide repeat protein, partial [Pseudomonadota bacterium]